MEADRLRREKAEDAEAHQQERDLGMDQARARHMLYYCSTHGVVRRNCRSNALFAASAAVATDTATISTTLVLLPPPKQNKR